MVPVRTSLASRLLKVQSVFQQYDSQPYTIDWIKIGGKISVAVRCKVSFFLGKYKNEVYSNIVDMDACQLLFERPWQFDVMSNI